MRRASRRPTAARALVTVLATAAAAALLAAPAGAAPASAGSFDLSGTPGQIVVTSDGNAWTTISGSGAGNQVARITPNGVVNEFNPAALAAPVGIAEGPDGNLWLTQAGAVVRVPPVAPDTAVAFAAPQIADPRGIVSGPDGNLWTASGDKLLKIPPADPTAGEAFAVPGMGARGIAAGGNGELWIADFGGQRVVSVTTAGVPTFYDVGGGPQEIGAGPGELMLYSNPGSDPQQIGRLEPGGPPLLTETPLADPFGIAYGADGSFWVAEFAGSRLGRLTLAGGFSERDLLAAGSGPRYLASAPEGRLFVSLETAQKVALIEGLEPETEITAAPKKKIKLKRRKKARAKARFAFASSNPEAGFECVLRRRGMPKPIGPLICSSPQTYKKLKAGRYTFSVASTFEGAADSSPAAATFKVVKKKRRRGR